AAMKSSDTALPPPPVPPKSEARQGFITLPRLVS
ncbi:GAREM1 isoform 1, partial [Pan troglodytes]